MNSGTLQWMNFIFVLCNLVLQLKSKNSVNDLYWLLVFGYWLWVMGIGQYNSIVYCVMLVRSS